MRHRKKSEKLSRPRAQRKALVKSLLRALIINERIKTTTSKAKFLRTDASRLITWAKKGDLASRRMAFRFLEDRSLVKRLFDVIGPRFKEINGGYVRVLGLGHRSGDGAAMSLIELTKRQVKKKIVKAKKGKEGQPTLPEKKEKKENKVFKKEEKPKKGIISGVRKIFKKERDGL